MLDQLSWPILQARRKLSRLLTLHKVFYQHLINTRAVRYHLKFAYHDTIVRVSRYTLGIDTSHDMAYMR